MQTTTTSVQWGCRMLRYCVIVLQAMFAWCSPNHDVVDHEHLQTCRM
jgi:hypothetical protein